MSKRKRPLGPPSRGGQQSRSQSSDSLDASTLGELLAGAERTSPPEVEAVLEKLDPPDAQIVRTAILSQSFSGPLPPPGLLREYAEIIPDGGNRIMTMAENEQALRTDILLRSQANEDKIIANDVVMSRNGQNYGFIGLLALLASSVAFAFLGMQSLAVGTVIGTVGTYAANLIQARTLAREAAKEAAKKQG